MGYYGLTDNIGDGTVVSGKSIPEEGPVTDESDNGLSILRITNLGYLSPGRPILPIKRLHVRFGQELLFSG